MSSVKDAPRYTAIELSDRYVIVAGDPILDTEEGTLTMMLGDNTFKIYNWRYVHNFYHMTVEETMAHKEAEGETNE